MSSHERIYSRRPSIKSAVEAVGELFQTREGLVRKQQERDARLEAIGGLDAVRTMPMDEIEEALGLNDVPMVDTRTGIVYPSRNESRRKSQEAEARLTKWLERDASPVALFERVKNRIRPLR